jgi:hypothetical protein
MGLPDDENTQCLKAQVRSHGNYQHNTQNQKRASRTFNFFKFPTYRISLLFPTLTPSRKHNVAATSTSSKMKPSKVSETIKVVFRVRPLNSKEKQDGRQM